MRSSKFLALCALAASCWALPCPAQEPAQFKTEVWLNGGVLSYHFRRDKDYREENWGFGAEALFARRHGVLAGTYLNSENSRSRYFGYEYRPFVRERNGLRVSVGVAFAAVDGYPSTRDGNWFPAAIPALNVEGKRVGMSVLLLPNFKQGPALAFELKLKAWN
jgi:hypothetical protein